MSRPSHRPSRRPARRPARLLAGAVLAVAALAGATKAEATPNATDLEATVLRINGAAITGTTIPAGRTLTPVRLTTTDPNTFEGDGYALTGEVAPTRIKRVTIPGQPAENATFRIDGSVVATSVPVMRPAQLQTDAGPLTALVFTANGVTYALPQAGVGSATRTVAPTSLPTNGGGVSTYRWGLLPVGAQARVGVFFSQSKFGGTPMGTGGVGRATVVDADNVRRNVDTSAEELVFRGEPATSYTDLIGSPGDEVTAMVRLRSGATLSLNALSFSYNGYAGYGYWTIMFDLMALAAAGATIDDVSSVISLTPTDHSLTWQDLGFDLA